MYDVWFSYSYNVRVFALKDISVPKMLPIFSQAKSRYNLANKGIFKRGQQ